MTKVALVVVVVLGLVGFVDVAHADEPRTLTVATYNDPPFSIKAADGTWSGIAIELLRQVASELNATIVVRETPAAQLVKGPLPDVDIVTTLVLGEKMNARYELSHAFYSTGLAIAVPEQRRESVLEMLARIFSGAFLWILIGTVVLLAGVGLLMWWVERRPVKPVSSEKQALSKSLFWAFEPVIGYKASQHVTRAGRVIGTIWGVCGVVLVSGLTANLASQLTAHRLAPTVRGPDDLPHVRMAIVEHTAAVTFCNRRGLRRTLFPDLDHALTALEHGDVDVVLDDAPNLAYASQQAHPHIHVLPGTFANHGYALGLPPDSPLRHDLNKAMLHVTSGDAWRGVIATYLGQAD